MAHPPPPVEASLFFKLVRVVNLTARPFVEGIGKDERLTLSEWRVMVVLAAHPGCAAQEVVASTALDKMTVSRAVDALKRQGRLLRSADPADRRRALLVLSAAGRRVYEKVGEGGKRREPQLFAAVTRDEQVALGKTLDALIENLLAQGE